MQPQLTQGIDVALVVFNAFVVFFIGLILYLRREDRREGYPLEDEMTGRPESVGGPLSTASPKTFRLPFGHGTVTAPRMNDRDPVDIAARRTGIGHGSPIEPTGNPLIDGIGPAAYANRAKRPDIDMEGHARIVPMSAATGYTIAARDPDPRGFTAVGADGIAAGTVTELWIDKADRLIRYFQVGLGGEAGRQVLVPMAMSRVDRKRGRVIVDAVVASQFADAPGVPEGGTITLYEEERVQGYFGGGYLYATPARSEPLL